MQTIETDFQKIHLAYQVAARVSRELSTFINETIDTAERRFAELATGELKIDVPRDRFDRFAKGSLADGETASLSFKDGSLFMSVTDKIDPANSWVRPIRECEFGMQFVASFTFLDLVGCWENGGVPQPMEIMEELILKDSDCDSDCDISLEMHAIAVVAHMHSYFQTVDVELIQNG